jgi:hypothetical protein
MPVIVVLGRPRVYRPEPDGDLAPGGLGVEVALALGRLGADVELVGSLGDDPEGDRIIVELGRARVGHAALLRDPSARTTPLGEDERERQLPRLEAADVGLGLRYVRDCRVLVVAEDLDTAAMSEALEVAAYHGAAVVIVASAGHVDPERLGDEVTLLERPGMTMADEDGEEADVPADARAIAAQEAAFAVLVADYARRLDGGVAPAEAFRSALEGGAWEPSAD